MPSLSGGDRSTLSPPLCVFWDVVSFLFLCLCWRKGVHVQKINYMICFTNIIHITFRINILQFIIATPKIFLILITIKLYDQVSTKEEILLLRMDAGIFSKNKFTIFIECKNSSTKFFSGTIQIEKLGGILFFDGPIFDKVISWGVRALTSNNYICSLCCLSLWSIRYNLWWRNFFFVLSSELILWFFKTEE